MKTKKIALITGITGQDGSYLAEFLLEKGYEVHGLRRRVSIFNTNRIDHIISSEKYNQDFFLHYGDLTDSSSLSNVIHKIMPDEIYNLAAQSHVAVSFEEPEYTANSDGVGVLRLLESIRILKKEKNIKFYQASTSELFGLVQEIPQKETTSFYPRSPYGAAKLYAYWITINYREAYDLFACNGILFNHESPRRGEIFVTRKITRALCEIKQNKRDILKLGNLNAKRDWGHAKDYVEAMWLMLQSNQPKDYVIATGKNHSIREFIEECCKVLNQKIEWSGEGINEIGIINGVKRIEVDPRYFRPTEVETLLGDPSLAKIEIGWKPKYTFEDLVSEMVNNDLSNLL